MSKSDKDMKRLKKSTQAIHAGNLAEPIFGEVSVPIFQTSTFSFPSADEGADRFSGKSPGYIYTRMGNPTLNALEENLSILENGYAGLTAASGMAAISTVFLTFLEQNSHIISTAAVYGPVRGILEKEFTRYGVTSTFVDSTNIENIRKALKPETKIIHIETPANPTMQITDIEAVAELAHNHGALLTVDNTFASPYLQRPLDHGADIVIHSLTKFINGHSDVVGGAIIAKDEKLYKRLRGSLNLFGGSMDPHQAWLILRGVRTLGLRVEKSQENAMKLARFLQGHKNVTWVNYPGLEDHPQYAVAQKQMDGFGAMISIGVKNGLDGGKTVMNNVQLFTLAVSLGGVESLIEHPASMTHASMPQEERKLAGISDELVRVAVGCEDYEDLRDDLDQALNLVAI
jgi:methionine-gamma-lyase